jgi:cytochrome c oxidase cbb3-type subunit 3
MKSFLHTVYSWLQKAVVVTAALLAPAGAFAAGPPKQSELSNPVAVVMLVVVFGLLLAIALLANVVIGAAKMYLQRYKETNADTTTKILSVILVMTFSPAAFAQDAAAATEQVTLIAGLSQVSFYSLLAVILLELVIMVGLLYNLKLLLAKEAALTTAAASSVAQPVAEENSWVKWWDKLNSFRPMKEEAKIDLGHNYDGIRELDNRLPPWWLYGFYVTIVFAGIYLWRYHVSHTAPLSGEEYAIAMAKAEAEKEAYLKKSANNVDENTVVLLTDASALAAGKNVFATNCAACHLTDGGGSVGPNLTDDYWLHGGSVKDIFKTVKYGVPEKGMRSWKEDLSPMQISQVTSYIKSLKGTKPANPKEPQGSLFEESAPEGAAADSAKPKIAALR